MRGREASKGRGRAPSVALVPGGSCLLVRTVRRRVVWPGVCEVPPLGVGSARAVCGRCMYVADGAHGTGEGCSQDSGLHDPRESFEFDSYSLTYGTTAARSMATCARLQSYRRRLPRLGRCLLAARSVPSRVRLHSYGGRLPRLCRCLFAARTVSSCARLQSYRRRLPRLGRRLLAARSVPTRARLHSHGGRLSRLRR